MILGTEPERRRPALSEGTGWRPSGGAVCLRRCRPSRAWEEVLLAPWLLATASGGGGGRIGAGAGSHGGGDVGQIWVQQGPIWVFGPLPFRSCPKCDSCGAANPYLQEVEDGGGMRVLDHVEEGKGVLTSVRGAGVLRQFGHDDEVLWWQRCEQLYACPISVDGE
jgi:hypothetical protein